MGSTVAIKNVLEIKNSDIVDSRSGALTISSYAQLTLYKGSRMIFENNTGRLVMPNIIFIHNYKHYFQFSTCH